MGLVEYPHLLGVVVGWVRPLYPHLSAPKVHVEGWSAQAGRLDGMVLLGRLVLKPWQRPAHSQSVGVGPLPVPRAPPAPPPARWSAPSQIRGEAESAHAGWRSP